MIMVRFDDDAIEIDAATLAAALGIEASSLQQCIRDGAVTTRCERGVDADEGRYRLTFLTERRRFRLIVDAAGNELQRSVIDFGERLARRPSGRFRRSEPR
jgi:hypothetical protein